jgi:hypothetical protein
VDFLRGSADNTLVPITVQVANRNLTYAAKDGVQHASVNIYDRVTTLSGKIVSAFEEPLRLDVAAELLEKFSNNVSLHRRLCPCTQDGIGSIVKQIRIRHDEGLVRLKLIEALLSPRNSNAWRHR